MSNQDYSECRKMLLGKEYFNLLTLGCPVDEYSLKRRIILLQNAGLSIDFDTFIEIIGLEDTPQKSKDTFEKIQKKMEKFRSICKDINKCKLLCQDLEDLEFE